MPLLSRETMAKTVRFQREPGFRTVEIQRVLAHGMLAPEFVT